MTLRPWRGPIVFEGVQTGDGRVMAEGSIEWPDLPLPLAWLRDGDQHISLTEVGPQIGTINTLERQAGGPGTGQVFATGFIDDENPDGAEVIRRMESGGAPFGDRFPVSIDPDNWEVQVIATAPLDAEDEGEGFRVLFTASGEGRPPAFTSRARSARAAAGDPDLGPDEGMLLFEDSVDEILERYTRLRIRGATCCSVAAFDGLAIELDGDAAATASTPPPARPVTAAVSVPDAPPLEWFYMDEPGPGDERLVEQADGSWAVPMTIEDDGRVFGHVARGGQAHRGYATRVTPPTSRTGYREFHTGYVVTADGTRVPVGPLVVGCDHAPDGLNVAGTRDHYASSGLGWADVRVIDGVYGPWMCGALRPGVTDTDLRVLRALAPSGDWRGPSMLDLELVSILAVNAPGFPIAREALAASAMVSMVAAAPEPRVGVAGGRVTSLVAAGMVRRCSQCAERERLAAAMQAGSLAEAELRAALGYLRRLERRTRHMDEPAIDALAQRIHA